MQSRGCCIVLPIGCLTSLLTLIAASVAAWAHFAR